MKCKSTGKTHEGYLTARNKSILELVKKKATGPKKLSKALGLKASTVRKELLYLQGLGLVKCKGRVK